MAGTSAHRSDSSEPAGAPWLVLEDVSFALPGGATLFSNVSLRLDSRVTGLVGSNGVGKSVLAELICGLRPSSGGTMRRSCSIAYVPQAAGDIDESKSVAEAMGLAAVFQALERVASDTATAEDIEVIGEQWDLQSRCEALLADCAMGHVNTKTPLRELSGGQRTCIAILGARLSGRTALLLDEPTNHLDRGARLQLMQLLEQWPGPSLVISHDRELLERVDRIVELGRRGARSYGGNYSFYRDVREHDYETAEHEQNAARRARRKARADMLSQIERLQSRQARAASSAKTANQSKLIMNAQSSRAEVRLARTAREHAARLADLDGKLAEAAAQNEVAAQAVFAAVPVQLPSSKRVLQLENLRLPYGVGGEAGLSFELHGPQRVAVVGPNGCGKSTLLKVIAGQLPSVAGECVVGVPAAYLDQHLLDLRSSRSILDELKVRDLRVNTSEGRSWLALLGLRARQVAMPTCDLSGGERIKAALWFALMRVPTPQLLILDEPTNHLDVLATESFEEMLRAYAGALLVASHDERLLENIGMTKRVVCASERWRLVDT